MLEAGLRYRWSEATRFSIHHRSRIHRRFIRNHRNNPYMDRTELARSTKNELRFETSTIIMKVLGRSVLANSS